MNTADEQVRAFLQRPIIALAATADALALALAELAANVSGSDDWAADVAENDSRQLPRNIDATPQRQRGESESSIRRNAMAAEHARVESGVSTVGGRRDVTLESLHQPIDSCPEGEAIGSSRQISAAEFPDEGERLSEAPGSDMLQPGFAKPQARQNEAIRLATSLPPGRRSRRRAASSSVASRDLSTEACILDGCEQSEFGFLYPSAVGAGYRSEQVKRSIRRDPRHPLEDESLQRLLRDIMERQALIERRLQTSSAPLAVFAD